MPREEEYTQEEILTTKIQRIRPSTRKQEMPRRLSTARCVPMGARQLVVELFKTASLSTLAHEVGHVCFLEMQRTVENGLADESMQKDYGKLCAYVGAKPGVRWSVDQNEKLARA